MVPPPLQPPPRRALQPPPPHASPTVPPPLRPPPCRALQPPPSLAPATSVLPSWKRRPSAPPALRRRLVLRLCAPLRPRTARLFAPPSLQHQRAAPSLSPLPLSTGTVHHLLSSSTMRGAPIHRRERVPVRLTDVFPVARPRHHPLRGFRPVQVSRCRGRPRKGADEPLQVPSLAAPPYDSRCPRQCRSTNLSLPVRFGEVNLLSSPSCNCGWIKLIQKKCRFNVFLWSWVTSRDST